MQTQDKVLSSLRKVITLAQHANVPIFRSCLRSVPLACHQQEMLQLKIILLTVTRISNQSDTCLLSPVHGGRHEGMPDADSNKFQPGDKLDQEFTWGNRRRVVKIPDVYLCWATAASFSSWLCNTQIVFNNSFVWHNSLVWHMHVKLTGLLGEIRQFTRYEPSSFPEMNPTEAFGVLGPMKATQDLPGALRHHFYHWQHWLHTTCLAKNLPTEWSRL